MVGEGGGVLGVFLQGFDSLRGRVLEQSTAKAPGEGGTLGERVKVSSRVGARCARR